MEKVSKGKLAAVAVGALFTMMAAGIVTNSTGYFITSVTDYLGCSRAAFSLYYSIVNVCTALTSLMMGPVIQKLDLRKTIAVSSVGVTAGFVIMSRVTILPMVYIGAAFIGVFQTFCTVTTIHIINRWYVDNAGFVTGLAMSGTGWAGVIMGFVMPQVVAAFNWRTAYLFCAGLFLAFSVLANVLGGGKAPESAVQSDAKDKKEDEKHSEEYRKLMKNPLFWGLMLCALASCILGSGFAQHLAAHLEGNNFNLVLLSAVMSVWSIGLAVFKILEGGLSDRTELKKFMAVTTLIGAVGLLAFAGKSTGILFAATLGFAWFSASITVLYPIIMRKLYGVKLASAAWGICWAAMMIGNAIGAPYYGAIYDATGSYNLGNVIGAGMLLVIMAAVVMMLHKSEKKVSDSPAEIGG